MKKFVSALLAVVFGVLCLVLLAGCNTYKVPENHCIVGLHKNYRLYSDAEGKLCEPVGQKIRGVQKEYNTNYYSVVKGATYSIVCDDFIDDGAGFGSGLNSYDIAAAWWQGNIVTSFVKTYGENTGKQDEVFFETSFSNVGRISTDVTVVFNENCLIKAVTEPYLYVGGIFEVMDKGNTLLDSKIGNYLDEFGNINEQDGFYYLLLNDEVCMHQDAWKTNLDVNGYKYEYIDGGWNNAIQAQFTAKQPVVAENEDLFMHIVCRTFSGKYFIYPLTYQGLKGFTMPIREHELKLTFEK